MSTQHRAGDLEYESRTDDLSLCIPYLWLVAGTCITTQIMGKIKVDHAYCKQILWDVKAERTWSKAHNSR